MDGKIGDGVKSIVYSRAFERFITHSKKSNKDLFQKIVYQVEKIVREPSFGKPLRYTLKNRRRVHIESYVLVYELVDNELRFLDCDHHDKIYKKFS